MSMYRNHMETLKALVLELKAPGVPVFVTGDLNVNYRRDVRVQDPAFPYVNLSQVRVEASYASLGLPAIGTHVGSVGSTRLIDNVPVVLGRSAPPAGTAIAAPTTEERSS
jgi:hypothetical protein